MALTSEPASLPHAPLFVWSAAAMRWSAAALVAASWFSAAFFGAYILAFYAGAIPAGRLDQWNDNLPGLYVPGNRTALVAMAGHLVTGGTLLLLGPIQLIGPLRNRWPFVHRWIGRLYVAAAAMAGVGGLVFILDTGTIGGLPMDVGFGLYGLLMVVAAAATFLHARARRTERHRAWAIRLFALAIGSWLYRMDYGFWLMAADGIGHTGAFRGPFDIAMAFLFYLPNLAIAELLIRSRGSAPLGPYIHIPAAIGLAAATFFVGLGTYYFMLFYWGPAIVGAVAGR